MYVCMYVCMYVPLVCVSVCVFVCVLCALTVCAYCVRLLCESECVIFLRFDIH